MSSNQTDLGFYYTKDQQLNIPGVENLSAVGFAGTNYVRDFNFGISQSFVNFELINGHIWSSADPCKPSTIKTIDNTLRNFFQILKGIKEYKGIYFDTAIGEASNLTAEISKTVSIISGVLRTLTQRIRTYVLDKVKNLIRDFVEYQATPWLKEKLSPVLGKLIDQVLCAFDKLIGNLANLVGDFLFALINLGVNNPVLCAAEAYVSALLDKLATEIENAIQPILAEIQNLLGGISTGVGNIFSYIDLVLGYEGLLCSQPVCPEDVANFKTGPFGGPLKKDADNWKKDAAKPSTGLSNFNKSAQDFLNEKFPTTSQNSKFTTVPCNTGPFDCGSPQLVFFGGGGSGASGNVVVNGIGQVLGVNLLNGGKNYQTAPFVTITDPAECGKYASAYSVINDDGEVIQVVLTPGTGYSSVDNGGVPSFNYFYGTPNPVQVGNSITLNWSVNNYTSLSLSTNGSTISGYENISVGSTQASFVVSSSDVQFAAGSNQTTKTYTLTAVKTNTNSESQTVSQDYVFTVSTVGVGSTATEVTTVSPPLIDSFTGSPSIGTQLTPGSILTLSWETTNATSVTLSPAQSSTTTLPVDGSVSVTIPSDVIGIVTSYTLTATNTNAPAGQQSVTQIISYTIGSASDGQVSSTTGTGITTTTSETGTTGISTNIGNSVSTLNDIIVLNSGIDYDPTDNVNVVGGNNGATFELITSPIGQIVAINILTPGYGFTTIPEIQINSKNGVGAKFLATLDFIPIDQLEKDIQIDSSKLVKVIDCVYK